ncbi:MAG: ribose-phosphate diphosphokinase [Stenotrophomonas sp.]|nr:ribose-phosphate diphosphokinase [Stenotrophomonas sp.]MTI75594.1 ribose-phosphate diphosphokinase [Stenotrophomonas sp.]
MPDAAATGCSPAPALSPPPEKAHMQDAQNLLVFSGNANKPLAQSICKELGVQPGKALVSKFSDGEVQVEIQENVRKQDVFVVQPTCAPSAENLMELLVIIDALKRASAASVTAVVPYFGYARQDRRMRSSRVPITAKVAAKMFSAVHTDQILTVDLHADQIQGFFDMPVDNVYASPLLLADIWRAYGTDNLIVVSPDVGGVVRARAVAKRLDDADLAIIDKRRPRANVATVMNIIGDVEGKTCVMVDDIVDTAGTLCAAAAALKARGAVKVAAYCTHAVLSGPAVDNLNNSQLDELVVTDTIPLSDVARVCTKIRQISVAEMLAETMRRIAFGESVSSMYVD